MRTLDRPGLEQARGRHRAAGVHSRFVRHAAANQRVGTQTGGGRRRAGHDPPREGREHGDGARRGQSARLAAGAVQNQARNRRQLLADAARGDAAGEYRGRAAGHRVAQLVHAGLRPGAGRCGPVHSIACSSKCSKAWRTTSGGRCSSSQATCCSTRRLAGRRISRTRSATSSAGSTRTPARTISCGTRSTSKWTARHGRRSSSSSSQRIAAMDSVASAPRRTQDRRRMSESRGVESSTQSRSESGIDSRTLGSRLVSTTKPDTDWSLPHKRRVGQVDCRNVATAARHAGRRSPARDRRRGDPRRPARSRVASIRRGPVWSWPDTARRRSRHRSRRGQPPVPMPTAGGRRTMVERVQILAPRRRRSCGCRGDLMGAMLAEGGKTLTESDPEVSEAIDFCRFYGQIGPISFTSCQVSTVTRPRRGRGRFAVELSAGDSVRRRGGGLGRREHRDSEAGVRHGADRLLAVRVLLAGRRAADRAAIRPVQRRHGRAAARDARRRRCGRPHRRHEHSRPDARRTSRRCNLLAETGGKNATIVTALSDRDQAIKNVLHSAFSHSGQKCSATSLLILESEVYHDAKFRAALCDAVESLRVGSAWELPTKIGPLIRPPCGVLETALKELEPGEEWAVMPRLHVDDNPQPGRARA